MLTFFAQELLHFSVRDFNSKKGSVYDQAVGAYIIPCHSPSMSDKLSSLHLLFLICV